MPTYNTMQLIKRSFFAMRNGVVADALRRTMPGYRVIFGLNLPQIVDIARQHAPSAALAEELWADTRTRESRLMAPMVYPPELMDRPTALRWMASASTTEEADILCHRLLRRLPFAAELTESPADEPADMMRYVRLRLARNLLPADADRAERMARRELERGCGLTKMLCLNILDETDFLKQQ